VAELQAAVRAIGALGHREQWLQLGPPVADIAVMNPLHAPLPSWMSRLVARRPAVPSSSLMHSRVEVRPPELWPSSLSWHGRTRRLVERLVSRVAPWLPAPARPVNRLALAKREFQDSLFDVPGEPAQVLLDRIGRARSLREMWHLRSSLYGEVAMALTQSEAERRLARLNRHFPTRAPRSALMPLES
jgi:hypothetical protein